MMNIGFIVCIIMAGIFLVLAIVFALLKEKGAMLVSGFNTLPREERERYDKRKISTDMRNSFLIWGLIFILGGIFSYLVSSYAAIAAGVLWLILFFKEVHFDTDKAFGKYRLQ